MAIGLIAGAIGAGRALTGMIAGNQTKQRNKGLIGRAYRRNAEFQDMQQADVRQGTNEALNARGVFTPGVQSVTMPKKITTANPKAGGGTMQAALDQVNQQIQRAAGAQKNAVGAANTLSSGVNQNLTHQFVLERQALEDATRQAYNQNDAQYLNGLIGSAMSGINTAASIQGGIDAGNAASAINPTTPELAMPMRTGLEESAAANRGTIARALDSMRGAYDMPVSPNFRIPVSRGTLIGGEDTMNYNLNVE